MAQRLGLAVRYGVITQAEARELLERHGLPLGAKPPKITPPKSA